LRVFTNADCHCPENTLLWGVILSAAKNLSMNVRPFTSLRVTWSAVVLSSFVAPVATSMTDYEEPFPGRATKKFHWGDEIASLRSQ